VASRFKFKLEHASASWASPRFRNWPFFIASFLFTVILIIVNLPLHLPLIFPEDSDTSMIRHVDDNKQHDT
jgi:hypothetical protein